MSTSDPGDPRDPSEVRFDPEMRRADRLFQIVQLLRRSKRPMTAEAIAAELEISKRSVYRDIASLLSQRVPIRGEAGVGYVMEKGFDLPPLMLTPDEIEAIVLGAQWVAGHGDTVLARAALDVRAKIAAVVPERLRPLVLDSGVATPPRWMDRPDTIDMGTLRATIRAGQKVSLEYRDEKGAVTQRMVWPVAIGYTEVTRMLIAWCELRTDFRSFRTDRVVNATFLEERYPETPATLRAKWRKALATREGERMRERAKDKDRHASGCGDDGRGPE
jgi:predicted DNA-binding transcriptional regulator YafY